MVLKNMFTPTVETDPNWDIDIQVRRQNEGDNEQEDVKSECQKYGNVLHCFVDKKSDGNVYLMFEDTNACHVAADAMNGRWFNCRQIQVAQVFDLVVFILVMFLQVNILICSLMLVVLLQLLKLRWLILCICVCLK